jgi:hypothetical protein
MLRPPLPAKQAAGEESGRWHAKGDARIANIHARPCWSLCHRRVGDEESSRHILRAQIATVVSQDPAIELAAASM